MALPAFREDGWFPAGHHLADWEDVETRFGAGQVRAALTRKLIAFRDELRTQGIQGYLVLDGSYVSAKLSPNDFDVLLVAAPGCQALVNADPEIARLLDAERAEKERGFTLLFIEEISAMLSLIKTVWDVSKQGVPKGVVEVTL